MRIAICTAVDGGEVLWVEACRVERSPSTDGGPGPFDVTVFERERVVASRQLVTIVDVKEPA